MARIPLLVYNFVFTSILFCYTFDYTGLGVTVSPERPSARMSKIINDGLTRYICIHMATVGDKVLIAWRSYHTTTQSGHW